MGLTGWNQYGDAKLYNPLPLLPPPNPTYEWTHLGPRNKISSPWESMHAGENIIKDIVRCISGKGDSVGNRNYEYTRSYRESSRQSQHRPRRAMLHEASLASSSSSLHHAIFRLSEKEVEVIQDAYNSKMKVPSHWDVRPDYYSNSGSVKAHEWYMFVACEVMDYGLFFSTHLGDRQKEAILWFGRAWSSLHVKRVLRSAVPDMQEKLVEALWLLEVAMPVVTNSMMRMQASEVNSIRVAIESDCNNG